MNQRRNQKDNQLFELPATIIGIQAKIAVLEDEISTIEEQLASNNAPQHGMDIDAYMLWRGKATVARQWKMRERAFLLDHQWSLRLERLLQSVYSIVCDIEPLSDGEVCTIAAVRDYLAANGLLLEGDQHGNRNQQ